ncbi:MAG: adenylyltransferase/cytidyltransferase family protein [Candidatus ainarchaeum sp.]|nr:adenylyltransferase/cytidyltransferase family protein [Candidatus ainarchaeum sp.]
MKEAVKRLYVMQLQYGGIPEDVYHFLPDDEKKLLVEIKGRFFLRNGAREKIRVVLTGGVFDVLHIGHIVTLAEAKTHGDVLVVALAMDEHIMKKGRTPVHPQEYRRMLVESLKAVDVAVSGFDRPEMMLDFVQPDVIVYGYDQKEFLRPKGVEVVRLDKKVDDRKFKTGKILELLGL